MKQIIKQRLERARAYALAQLGQASTWRGLALLFTVGGMSLSADQKELILTAGLALSGAIGAIFPDGK